MVDCKTCKSRFREDQLPENCNKGKCDFTEARQFNLMFKTNVGPIDDGTSFAYLRPETHNKYLQILKMLLIRLQKHYHLALHR